MKRNLQATAKAFQAEGKVSSDPVGMHLSASRVELFFFSFEFFQSVFSVVCQDYYLLPKNCFFPQQLMHLVAFFLSGGQFFGIYS